MEPNPIPEQPPLPPLNGDPIPVNNETAVPIQPEPPSPAAEPPHPEIKSQVFQPAFSSPSPGTSPAVPEERPLGVAGPAVQNGAIVGQIIGHNDQEIAQPGKKFFNRKIIMIAAAVFVVCGGSAAAYFGYVQPNKPENIWKTALSRTGKGYDQLTKYAVDQFSSKSQGIKLDGNFKLSGDIAADGSFSGSTDKDNGEFTGNLSVAGIKVNADIRLIKSGTSTPDVYFKVDGIQGLGDLVGGFVPQYTSALNGLNGNWYFIDHTLFDQFSQGSNSGLQITQDDVKSVLNAIGDASNQNIFTDNPENSAFTVQKQIGKEKQDGRGVYHYLVSINKDNLKTYVDNLCANLEKSNLKKFFNNDTQQVGDSLGCTTAAASISKFNSNRTADVWVDLHTKLVHKVRISDPGNKDSYFEISQDYQGGTQYPFGLFFHSKDSSSTIGLTLDTKVNSLTIKAKTQDSMQGGANGAAELTVKPSSGSVNVQKPVDAKNILQLLNDLGIAQTYNDIQSQAKDTERKTDINALHGQIEAYQAQYGYYPTLTNLNDPSWVSKNMTGLDPAAFQDPAGSSSKLSASPGTHVYSYQPSPSGCNNTSVQCTDYTLTATLDSGGTYVKQALNLESGTPVYQN